ncbi:MAG TPA: hypothetical protein VJI68_02565 [Candidatus Nanoarchaeia archaeon]|nr:hypothetical protein [Candidatus Nanoarchaeia archaeon]
MGLVDKTIKALIEMRSAAITANNKGRTLAILENLQDTDPVREEVKTILRNQGANYKFPLSYCFNRGYQNAKNPGLYSPNYINC